MSAVSVRPCGIEVRRRDADAAEDRRRDAQRHFFRERREMPRVQAFADGHAHLELPQALVDRLNLGGLLPGRRHQRFLMVLDHLRPERRRRAPPGIEIQRVEPVRGPRGHDARAPHAIARTRGGASSGSALGAITWFRPGLLTILESSSSKAGAAGSDQTTGALLPVSGSSAPSTFTVVFGSRPCHLETGLADRHGSLTQSRRDIDSQTARQQLEVATFAGAELPGVVDGQDDLRRRGGGQRPCGRERIRARSARCRRSAGRARLCVRARRSAPHTRGSRCWRSTVADTRAATARGAAGRSTPRRRRSASSAAACPCAHAQQSFRSGSSRNGFAGAAILSVGSGASTALVSWTPSCCRTTTRQSHGRSCPFVLARAGVNSQGKSARSNSIDGKKFGSKSVVSGTRIGAHDLVAIDADHVGRPAQPQRHGRQRVGVDLEGDGDVGNGRLSRAERVDGR